MKEITELATFLCDLGNGIDKSLEDGKIQWTDALNFVTAVTDSAAAFMGISQVSEEYFNLTDQQKAELRAHISAKLQLSNASVATITDNVISVALQLNVVLKAILQAKQA